MALIISRRINEKLASKSPPVTEEEIIQCFASRSKTYLEDIREEHKTNPPTKWFIGETDRGRKLKIAFVPDGGDIYIKTAYDPNEIEMHIYRTYSHDI